MITRRTLLAGAVTALSCLAAAACGSSGSKAPEVASRTDDSAGPTKAAWVMVANRTDNGWNAAHFRGSEYVRKQLVNDVVVTVKEDVPEGAPAAKVIDDLVADGNKIIFANSFGFGDAMAAAAVKYPDVRFEHATGTHLALGDKLPANLSEYFGAGEDAIYLTGMAAGRASQNGKLGFVASFPIPELIRHVNAFALGAQATHPGAQVKVLWTHQWFDPSKEKAAAEELVTWGADVITQGTDSPATGDVAKTAGVKWIGYDSDQSGYAPANWLTAAVYDWGPYYLSRVKAVREGTWTQGSYWGGMRDGFASLATFGSSVDAATQAAIAAKRQDIVSGTFDIFTGPVADQAGTVRIPAGSKATLEQRLTMDYLVKGVEGNPAG